MSWVHIPEGIAEEHRLYGTKKGSSLLLLIGLIIGPLKGATDVAQIIINSPKSADYKRKKKEILDDL